MLEPRGFGLCVLSVFHRGDERNPGREQSRVLFNERSCVLCWHCVYNHIRSRDGLLHGWEKAVTRSELLKATCGEPPQNYL